jgi:hypothetical protein
LADELLAADRSELSDQHQQVVPVLKEWAMMPYDSYRLYQVQRVKSRAEVRRADEQAARLACAISSLLRGITRPGRAMRSASPIAAPGLPRPA